MSSTSKNLMKIKEKNLKGSYTLAGNPSDEEILLLNEPHESDSIYRELGIPSKKDHIEKELIDIKAVKAYENIFAGLPAFKGSYIKEMANKYFLQIRKLNRLHGYLPQEAVLKIKEFVDAHDKAIVESSFYILAGKECFLPEYEGKEVKTYVLFFVEPSDSRGYSFTQEHYTMIQFHSSGNDWSSNRQWLIHLDKDDYNCEDCLSMYNSTIISFTGLMFPALTFMFLQCGIASNISAVLYSIFFLYNHYLNSHNYKLYWNGNKN